MPTAQDILDSFIGINGFSVDTAQVIFKHETMTAIIGIKPVDSASAICGGCGRRVERIKDRRRRFYLDKPVFNWNVRLMVNRRRVMCPRCGVRFEELAFVDGRSRCTKRFERMVFDDSTATTIAAAAKKHHVSWHRAARIEYKLLERYNEHRGPLVGVRWLGADEICYGNRNELFTIVTDIERGSVIGIIDGHQTASLDSFFKLAGPRFCEGIEVACVDMWKAYRSSIERFCSNAFIIYDKFHIMRHLNEAIDEVRRAAFFRQGGEKRELVRGKRWLLLRRWFNLTVQQKGLLKELFAVNKRLSVAHYLKEIFGELWTYKNPTWALKFLDRWEEQLRWQRLQPLKKFMQMVRKHIDGILNYCKAKVPLGLVEAVNGRIKEIIRRARGFINRRHGALKIMFLTDPNAHAVLAKIHT